MGYIFSSLRYAGKVADAAVKVAGPQIKEAGDIWRDSAGPDRDYFAAGLETQNRLSLRPRDQGKVGLRSAAVKDRRKISQRVLRQPVLIEFRCGIDRRRRHQRGSDIVVHIDEKA